MISASRSDTFAKAQRAAGDDRTRSAHIRRLLHGPGEPAIRGPGVPPVVVQFWHDRNRIPSDVLRCISSWTALQAAGFEHQLFDDTSARALVAALGPRFRSAFEACGHPAMRSDYFRLCYLLVRGGIYIDADDVYNGGELDVADRRLQVQPLCFDLDDDDMVPKADYLGPTERDDRRIFYVNNNPLIAPPRHPIISRALHRATGRLLDGAVDIQSTTGPGNLTASIVAHSLSYPEAPPSFVFLRHWDEVATSCWPLSYRTDERNWRLWDPNRTRL
jgi:hypothetical protein